jgi:hypothetical protein
MTHRAEKPALALGTGHAAAPVLARLELVMLEALMVAAVVAFGAALVL